MQSNAALPAFLEPLLNANGVHADARARFLASGWPNQSWEDWRYTNLNALNKTLFRVNKKVPEGVWVEPISVNPSAFIVCIDGVMCHDENKEKKYPKGVTISFGVQLHENSESWHDLNEALTQTGVMIHVADGVDAGTIECLSIQSNTPNTTHHLRHTVILGKGSKLQLITRYMSVGDALGFITHYRSAILDKDSHLNIIIMNTSGKGTTSFLHEAITISDNATCNTTLLNIGEGLTRQSVAIDHRGRNATSQLRALNKAADGAHVDLLTTMTHSVANTASDQKIAALASTKGRSVYQGKVIVAKDAQKTNAQQRHDGLLLSDEAEIDAKPSLEIYADDVVCSHGSTCGALDEQALFYLRSRGLSRDVSENLLIDAFTEKTFDLIDDNTLVNALRDMVSMNEEDN